ncbi:hypothetical protein FJZ31_38160 [Candidatus Poribacteria bacterium]|nr:hypothetical protein [Candidatus Poribacteria bacterium]
MKEHFTITETENKDAEAALEPSAAVEISKVNAEDAARRAILGMAINWEKKGDIYQATATYKDLIEMAPETSEEAESKEGLLRIAEAYQKEGATNSALSLYKYVMDH